MVASCYRRMGNKQQALNMYKDIHSKDPENLECKSQHAPLLCTLRSECVRSALYVLIGEGLI